MLLEKIQSALADIAQSQLRTRNGAPSQPSTAESWRSFPSHCLSLFWPSSRLQKLRHWMCLLRKCEMPCSQWGIANINNRHSVLIKKAWKTISIHILHVLNNCALNVENFTSVVYYVDILKFVFVCKYLWIQFCFWIILTPENQQYSSDLLISSLYLHLWWVTVYFNIISILSVFIIDVKWDIIAFL